MKRLFPIHITSIREHHLRTNYSKDGTHDVESLGWFIHFTCASGTPIAWRVSDTPPKDLRPGPATLILEQDEC